MQIYKKRLDYARFFVKNFLFKIQKNVAAFFLEQNLHHKNKYVETLKFFFLFIFLFSYYFIIYLLLYAPRADSTAPHAVHSAHRAKIKSKKNLFSLCFKKLFLCFISKKR